MPALLVAKKNLRMEIIGFDTFKLPESFRNCARSILLDQEMDLEKISSKNIYFFVSKFFLKKVQKKKTNIFKIWNFSFKSLKNILALKAKNFRFQKF